MTKSAFDKGRGCVRRVRIEAAGEESAMGDNEECVYVKGERGRSR